MNLYVNAGFGAPLGELLIARLYNLGWKGVRQDIPNGDPALTKLLVSEFVPPCPLKPLFLLNGTPEEVHATTRGLAAEIVKQKIPDAAIEVLNEPDQNPGYASIPEVHGTLTHDVMTLAAAAGCDAKVLLGGCMNASPGNLNYIARALSVLPSDAVVACHTYRDGPPTKPAVGYASRDDEVRSLVQVCGGRKLWITEIGWSNARRSWWPCVKPYSEQTVHDWLKIEAGLWKDKAEVMVVYQVADGPGSGTMDHFGIFRLNDSEKPAARLPLEV